MNCQSKAGELQLISQEDATWLIHGKFGEMRYMLEYIAWPRMYGNTAGPFSYPGRISGAAMSTFTLECWTDGEYAVIFCKGKLIEVIHCTDKPFNTGDYRG